PRSSRCKLSCTTTRRVSPLQAGGCLFESGTAHLAHISVRHLRSRAMEDGSRAPESPPSFVRRGRRVRVPGVKDAVGVAGKVGGGTIRTAGKETRQVAQALCNEPFWQAQAALVGALILYLTLPSKLVVGPTWLMRALE